MLFTLKYCGFQPRIALERFDSGEVRLQKIIELIEESLFSIHDLSRIMSEGPGEYFRLNMSLELGLDLGCRHYHGEKIFRNKRILILETIPFGIQKALSDMSFADAKCHQGDQVELCFVLREWFSELGFKKIPAGSKTWNTYNAFRWELSETMLAQGLTEKDIERLTIPEYLTWVDKSIMPKAKK